MEKKEFFIPIEAIAVPTLVISPDFTMIAANEARLKATGTTREQIIGYNLFDLFPENPNDSADDGTKNLRASLRRVLKEKVPDQMAIQRYDIPVPGTEPQVFEERYWNPVNTPVLNDAGEVIYILHQVDDVTDFVTIQGKQDVMAAEIYRRSKEIRAVNFELKLAKEQLEQKVEERTAQLHKSKEIAEAANRMKSAFLANMSHEIRTPLSAIIGFTELLKEKSLKPAERDQFLDTISRSGKALTRLIDDILDLAKVEAGRLHVEKIDFSLSELLTDTVELFRETARQKNIYLRLHVDDAIPERICSDPSRLRQILVNLIGNAIKFTAEGGIRVEVNLVSKMAEDLQFRIDITDTGIGLTHEQRVRLFQPFAQADDSRAREYGGTGLGLALSKRLSEALGGDINITRYKLGEGCTFTLNFPATAANDVAPFQDLKDRVDNQKSDKQQESLKGIRVLAVDDAPDNLFLVRRYLLKSGAIVDMAENGEEALAKTADNKYDIVLMDIQMPRLDGYQSKKALDERGYDVPIVALTAHAMKEEREKTKEAGFYAHLTKPLDKRELVRTVAGIVSEYRAGVH